MADLSAVRLRLSFEDLGITARHFLILRKALELAPESFNSTPYGITNDERLDADRLLVLLAMHLPPAEFQKVLESNP